MLKKYIISSFLCLVSLSCFANIWEQSSLNQAALDAKVELTKFINQNENSKIYSILKPDALVALNKKMQAAAKIEDLSFTALTWQNYKYKGLVLKEILKNSSYNLENELIPYLYLASTNRNFSNSDKYKYTYKLYRTILRSDPQSSQFAFNQLSKTNKKFAAKFNYNSKKIKKMKNDLQNIYASYGFYFYNFSINKDRDLPQICLKFNQGILPAPQQNWNKFVTITPKTKNGWHYRANQLCTQALWEKNYKVIIDPNLKSVNNIKLINNELTNYKYYHHWLNKDLQLEAQVFTGRKDPMLRYTTLGNTINIKQHKSITIETANVAQVKVKLWQIPTNNLANSFVRNLLNMPRLVNSWEIQAQLKQNARLIKEGTFNIKNNIANKVIATKIELNDLIDKKNAGVYLIQISDNLNQRNYRKPVLAFSLSNAGFSAYKTKNSLLAELRDLSTATPIDNTKVTLYAKDNAILAAESTDKNGLVTFSKASISGKNGAAPSHLIAISDKNLAYLNLNGSSIDLSSKGLSGTTDYFILKSWVWTERNIYRANDNLHSLWVVRNKDGSLFTKAPIWLRLIKPDGKLFASYKLIADKSGTYRFNHKFTANSRLGTWQLAISLAKDGTEEIKRKEVQVQAITAKQVTSELLVNGPLNFSLKANWLYGAPGANLSSKLLWSIHSNAKIKGWEDWQIGDFDEDPIFDNHQLQLAKTDKNGISNFKLKIANMPISSTALELKLRSQLFEPSGQVITASASQEILQTKKLAALKVDNKIAKIAILDKNRDIVAAKLKWKLYRVEYDYYWSREHGHWQYLVNTSRELAKTGDLTTNASKITTLELPLDSGSWILAISTIDNKTSASIPIEYGTWMQANINETPDSITIKSDKLRYAPDEIAKIHLKAPFDGLASIKIAQKNILETHQIEFKDGKATFNLKWQNGWQDGIWLLVNAWNCDQINSQNRRAVALLWLGANKKSYTLDLKSNLPTKIISPTNIKFKLSINKNNLETWGQVAIIDEGLYTLAPPSFKDPLTTFMGQYKIELEMYDIWGKIIQEIKAPQAAIRYGAGANSMAFASENKQGLIALPKNNIALVSYWSPLLKFDKNGQAQVDFTLPSNFNGKLRTMALAWNKNQFGSIEQTSIVTSPIVTEVYLPSYLTTNDKAQLKIRLHNTTNVAKKIDVKIESNLKMMVRKSINLAPKQELFISEFYRADTQKNADFIIEISGDLHKTITRSLDIRAAILPKLTRKLAIVKPGDTWIQPPFNKSSIFKQNLNLSTKLPFSINAVIDYLNTYPYNCAEQITSAAWNNLLLNDLVSKYDINQTKIPTKELRLLNIKQALANLANLQNTDGGFSLWGYSSSTTWLSAYITDFLLNLNEKGLLTNNELLERSLKYLTNKVMQSAPENYKGISYAHYVLAKAGMPTQGALLSLTENSLISTKLIAPEYLMLSQALLLQGEIKQAAQLISSINIKSLPNDLNIISQSLVMNTRLIAEIKKLQLNENTIINKLEQIQNKLMVQLIKNLTHHNYATYSAHWLAELAALLPSDKNLAKVIYNDKEISFSSIGYKLDNKLPIKIKNIGNTPIYLSLNSWLLDNSNKAQEHGFILNTNYSDLNNKTIDLTKLKLNQLVKVNFNIQAEKIDQQVLLNYPLAAGFTLVKSSKLNNTLMATFKENRVDRHIAAFNFKDKNCQRKNSCTYSFIMRASNIGDWRASNFSITDMFEAQNYASYPAPIFKVK